MKISKMTEIEKTKKRVRKNKKNEIRSAYKRIKRLVAAKISSATENGTYIVVNPELRLATFIIMKKLEREGFKCELKKGDLASTIFCDDVLDIDW